MARAVYYVMYVVTRAVDIGRAAEAGSCSRDDRFIRVRCDATIYMCDLITSGRNETSAYFIPYTFLPLINSQRYVFSIPPTTGDAELLQHEPSALR